LNPSYAADVYARIRGAAILATTWGVGVRIGVLGQYRILNAQTSQSALEAR
jgi:TPP-dependent 2-oxoacid decarboxylase